MHITDYIHRVQKYVHLKDDKLVALRVGWLASLMAVLLVEKKAVCLVEKKVVWWVEWKAVCSVVKLAVLLVELSGRMKEFGWVPRLAELWVDQSANMMAATMEQRLDVKQVALLVDKTDD